MRFLLINILAITGAVNAATLVGSNSSFDVGFSPNGSSLQLVLRSINSAKKSIHVAAYGFTSKPIAEALLNASKRGVEVKIVADEKSNSGKYSATRYLANNKIQVKLDGNYPIFHHKFMIIDGSTLETGSFNYSAAATNKNAENVLVLWNSPNVATSYEQEWQRLWNEAAPLSAKY
jgi:phosphatidylserine/phosphatidylglycerophosphate/cardiolipin synthase-like enzyme